MPDPAILMLPNFPMTIFFSKNCYFRDDLQILAYTINFLIVIISIPNIKAFITLYTWYGDYERTTLIMGANKCSCLMQTLSFLQIHNLEPFFLGTEDNHNSIILHLQRQPLYNCVAGHRLKNLMFTTMELKAKTKVTLVCLQ